jgi:hypothetical protein
VFGRRCVRRIVGCRHGRTSRAAASIQYRYHLSGRASRISATSGHSPDYKVQRLTGSENDRPRTGPNNWRGKAGSEGSAAVLRFERTRLAIAITVLTGAVPLVPRQTALHAAITGM